MEYFLLNIQTQTERRSVNTKLGCSPTHMHLRGLRVVLQVLVGDVTDEGHGEQEAGVDGWGEEGGGDGDPHTPGVVAAQDGEGHAHPAGDGHAGPDHQAAPAGPPQDLRGGPRPPQALVRLPDGGGHGQEVAGPVELHHEDTTEQEAAHHADDERVQLSLEPNPHELVVLDCSTKDNGQYGTHQGGYQHGGHQRDGGVLDKP